MPPPQQDIESLIKHCISLNEYQVSEEFDIILACPSSNSAFKANLYWLESKKDSQIWTQISSIRFTFDNNLSWRLVKEQEKVLVIGLPFRFEHSFDLRDSCFIQFEPEHSLICKSKDSEIFIPLDNSRPLFQSNRTT